MMTVQQFIEACRDRGLNVTYQRILIYRSLTETDRHPTAEEIFTEVKKEYPSISLATVYKTLETLVKHDLISKVNPLHDSARYDGDNALHHHMLCRHCGRVVDIADERLNEIDMPRQDNYRIAGYRILFEGWCDAPACRDMAASLPSPPPEQGMTLCGK